MKKKDFVINYIKEKISSGQWGVGTKIFSEYQFTEYLSVSKNTVRSAINKLCNENILETKQGSGSYVVNNLIGEKKYVLILSQEDIISGEIHYIFNILIAKIKSLLVLEGYKPIVYIGSKYIDINNSLSNLINEFAGVISIIGIEKDLNELSKHNIPIVSTFENNISSYPSVVLDYHDFFLKVLSLINANNFKDILVFGLKYYITRKTNFFNMYAIQKYFEKYDMAIMPVSHDFNVDQNLFKAKFNKLKRYPDAIVFLDDNLFIKCTPLFETYKDLFLKTHIITQTTTAYEYNVKLPYCQINFDIDEISLNTVKLLLDIIKKNNIIKYNMFIKPKILNKNILEK